MSSNIKDSGFNFIVDNDNNIRAELDFIKLQTINIKTVKRGRYITDPALVPDELKDKNILWIDEPVVVTAITEEGNEIPIYLSNLENQVNIEHKVIEPEE